MANGAAVDRVRDYYTWLDDGRYDRLRDLLHPSFRQDRPDRAFTDRTAFLRFMREERPVQETTHELSDVFATVDPADPVRIAAEGELHGPDGDRLFGFVDVHAFEDGSITQLSTYTD